MSLLSCPNDLPGVLVVVRSAAIDDSCVVTRRLGYRRVCANWTRLPGVGNSRPTLDSQETGVGWGLHDGA